MPQKQQPPTTIFSVCAPSDLQGLERWEAHLRPLEQANIISVWSARHLQPGTDRSTLLHDHLDHANFIVLLLSADFFMDDECVALMERALARHQQDRVRMIPLLLRPVAFHETKLAPFTPLPSNGSPVTLWQDPEAAFDDCMHELRRILGRPVTQPLTGRPKRPSVEEQNRARMLQRLRRTYEELFTQSLQGVTQIELGLADKPDAVQNAATLLFQSTIRETRLLPPGTSILDIYDEATYELLILGAPGAGKSTLLVELARQLVVRAEADERHPLPVILPLSSWAIKRSSLEIWMAEQVAQIYNIPKKIAHLLIEEGQILPLLDGLDEMDEAARPACIVVINAYHHDHLQLPLVVCSRQAEYEGASKSQRLVLQNAVLVQPLTYEHVQAYLKLAGKSLVALRRALATNETLAEVATTPLMMHVLILTYQGASVRQLSTQHKQLQQQIWTDYVQRMVERKGNTARYPFQQTRSWLHWLAQQMQTHQQTVFSLELLQPDWLSRQQQSFYRWSVRLSFWLISGLTIGLFFGLFFWLGIEPSFLRNVAGFLWPNVGLFWLGASLFLWLSAGLFLWLVIESNSKIKLVEILAWSWKDTQSVLVIVLLSGLLFGLALWLDTGEILWLDAIPIFWLVAGSVFGLSSGISTKQVRERSYISPNESIQYSVNKGLVTALVLWLATAMVIVLFVMLLSALAGMPGDERFLLLFNGLPFWLVDGLPFGLVGGLVFGLGAVMQHFLLRFWLWRFQVFPWSMVAFLEDARARNLVLRDDDNYRFVHRLLLDHLADTPTPHTEQPSDSMVTHSEP